MAGALFVHHDGALGDLLLSLPALSALKKRSGPLHLAGRPDAVRLLKELGFAAEAYDSGSGLFSSLHTPQPAPAAQEFLKGFDRAAVFTKNPSTELVRNIAAALPATKVVSTIPPDGAGVHVASFRLRQLEERSSLDPRCLLPEPLAVPAHCTERAQALLAGAGHCAGRPLIALHPGSGGAMKRWPLERYRELMERLREDAAPFFALLTGPAEEAGVTAALDDYARRTGDVLHAAHRELGTVAALLSLCTVYIGNDSGVTHLAAAVGARTVAVFGPTDPLRWGPLGTRVRIVTSEQACAPCGLREAERLRECEKMCLRELSAGSVLRAVRESAVKS